MVLRIYSTLAHEKKEFIPLDRDQVTMYVCGPNLYGPCHVGHAMSYIVFDTIKRYLQYRGHSIKHVQNFTDIEDRIVETARSLGIPFRELADKYIARFYAEMDALNVQRANFYPRATDVIPQIIEMVLGLIDKGYAYEVDGDVYYRVTHFADYGRLSGRSLEQMRAGARITVDDRKEHPMDFALWKAAKEGEPSWDSPWGKGRPGWHIECSAMSTQFLGDQIDIHGGGGDVIFPHHENEIAQSEAYTGKSPFARYWVHNGLLRQGAGDEKMTRHLGNFISVQDALHAYGADAIRLFILSSHYRSPITWTEEGVRAAQRGADRLRATMKGYSASPESSPGDALSAAADAALREFIASMDNDFGTPQAIAQVYDLARTINQARDNGAPSPSLSYARGVLKELMDVLGLTLQGVAAPTQAEPFVALLAEVRSQLRAHKLWTLADTIRDGLADQGVILEDEADGTTWRYTTS